MNKTISFFHAVNSGDLIAALSGMRQLHKRFGVKAVIYQRLDNPGRYMDGAVHPVKDDKGKQVTMNETMLNMLKPLIEMQEYVESIQKFSGEKFDIDLDRVHNGVFVNMPFGPLAMWPWFVFHNMWADLSEPWITVPPNHNINVSGINNKYSRNLEDCVILNFTQRYRNEAMTYHFLRRYTDKLVFAGSMEEYRLFTTRWKLDIPYLQINDFVELAQAIQGARALLCNQSMCWNIAEAMKTRRVLEYFPQAPNCFPFGKNGIMYLYQAVVEDVISEIMSEGKTELLCPVCETINKAAFNKSEVDYYRCSKCGTLYSKYLQQENMLGGLYEVQTEERRMQNRGRIERIKYLDCQSLLDFGCGNGELVEDAAAAGLQAFGYDKFNPGLHDVTIGAPFDCVSMIEVIEHTYHPYSELRIINDILKPDGYLYVETSFSDFLDMNSDYVDPVKGHCTIWSYKGMDMKMKEYGFELHLVINRNTRVYRKV